MRSTGRPPRRAPIGLPVFVAGAATFALEILGPRRIAPLVGTSLSSMTAAISVVLCGAAVGAAVAGRIADRGVSGRAVGWALVFAASGVAVGTHLARPAVAALGSELPHLVRALVGSIVMLLPASVALGAVPILAARLAIAERPLQTGILGRLSAIGTVGGFVGLFGAVSWTLPYVPVTTSLLGLTLVLALVGAALVRRGSLTASSVPLRSSAPSPRAEPGTDSTIDLSRLTSAAALLGFAILSIEVVAVRRVAARVGSSLEAWTAVLAVVLIATAIGAALARDGAPPSTRARRVANGAGIVILLGLLDDRVLSLALALPGLSPTPRVFLAVAIAYGPAFTLLGSVGPRLSRSAADDRIGMGRRLALVSIFGTVGALVGTLATAPILLPALRSASALAGASIAAIAAISLAGRGSLWVAKHEFAARTAPALIVLGIAIVSPTALRSPPPTDADPSPMHIVFDEDGPYARVVVARVPGPTGSSDRLSRLSIDARVHGVVVTDSPLPPRSPYVGLAVAVLDRAIDGVAAPRLLVLGGGAYAVPRAFLATHPDGICQVIELDPTVNEAARAHLGLVEDSRLLVLDGDGRTTLSSDSRVARELDLIFVDAFGDVSIPWTLTTIEFAREAKSKLRPRGTLVVNAIDAFIPGRLVASLRATLHSAFARVDVVGTKRDDDRLQNFFLVASDIERSFAGVTRATTDGAVPIVRYDPRELDALEREVGARPLTDDFAPVEDLVAEVVARTMGR